jgi:hypothetical protein
MDEFRSINGFLYNRDHNRFSNQSASGQATGGRITGILFLLALLVIAACGCKNTEYVVKGKDKVKKVYPGDDVYRDTYVQNTQVVKVVHGQDCQCSKCRPKPQPPANPHYAPQGNYAGHHVVTGIQIEHDTYAYGPHLCQAMWQLGKAVDGQIVWRTKCGANYPNLPYEPFIRQR